MLNKALIVDFFVFPRTLLASMDMKTTLVALLIEASQDATMIPQLSSVGSTKRRIDPIKGINPINIIDRARRFRVVHNPTPAQMKTIWTAPEGDPYSKVCAGV
jgi:hypothetical protein